MSKYDADTAFLVGDGVWQDALALLPVTTWTAHTTAEYAMCSHAYGGGDRVCAYPTLIYHREDAGVDLDAILHFLDRAGVSRIVHLGPVPEALSTAVVGLYTLEELTSLSASWSAAPRVVRAASDYRSAATAAVHASLIGVPLLIDGYNAETVPATTHVVCVGLADPDCDELLSADQVMAADSSATDTDALVLAATADLERTVTSGAVNLERTPGQVTQFYYRLSLAAPYLAAAKHEALALFDLADNSPAVVDGFLDDVVTALGSTTPHYLAILAAPNVIAQARYNFAYRRQSGTPIGDWSQVDGVLYGDLDGDLFQDLRVGRIYGLTVSDVSAYIATVLFNDRLPHATRFAALTSFHRQFAGPLVDNTYVEAVLSGAGLTNQSATAGYGASFDSSLYGRQAVLAYSGHGSTLGGMNGFNTSTLRSTSAWMPSTIVSMSACSTCSFDTISNKSSLFCTEAIRRGATAVLGATDVTATNASVEVGFLSGLVSGKDLGSAFRDASNLSFADPVLEYSPVSILLGDPTFRPALTGADIDRVHVVTAPLEDLGGYQELLAVDITTDAATTRAMSGVRNASSTRLDVTAAPALGGEHNFRSHVWSFHQYPDPAGSGGVELSSAADILNVVFSFANPSDLSLGGVVTATRTVNGATTDISSKLPFNPDSPSAVFANTNRQHETWVMLRLPLSGGDLMSLEKTAIPETQFHVGLLFEP